MENKTTQPRMLKGIVVSDKMTKTVVVKISGLKKHPKYKKYFKVSKKTLVEWPEIKKSLNSFTLEANQGAIKEKEVIGVLGENGIGKTTFVRILAGEIPFENFKEKLKVAYKPQYITPTDDLVAVALKKCDKNQIKSLDLDSLMLKKLSQLSGGELQRVMIAKTLFEEADIYLIDEPSAYLDVEQRLIVSRLIKDNIFLKEKSAVEKMLQFPQPAAPHKPIYSTPAPWRRQSARRGAC